MCRTIAGNKCEYITITAKNHPDVILFMDKIFIVKIRKKRSLF
jgi:hypothetical protein